MNILICGSSGFIGTHLSLLLAKAGHRVSGIDLVVPKKDNGLFSFRQGDICNQADVRIAMENIDCVINLAAKHHDFGISKVEYFHTNVFGSKTLLAEMAARDIRKYVFYSSVAVYGADRVNCDETSLAVPANSYGESKLAAEKIALRWSDDHPERSVLIFRPVLVFGEGNTANMYSLIRQIESGFFFHFGSSCTVKSVCYIHNITRATQFCMERMKPGMQIFNYADKPDLTVNQLTLVITQALGHKRQYLHFPLWLGLMAAAPFDLYIKVTGKNFPISSARIRKLATRTQFDATAIRKYGYTPGIPLEEGIRNMTHWYLESKGL